MPPQVTKCSNVEAKIFFTPNCQLESLTGKFENFFNLNLLKHIKFLKVEYSDIVGPLPASITELECESIEHSIFESLIHLKHARIYNIINSERIQVPDSLQSMRHLIFKDDQTLVLGACSEFYYTNTTPSCIDATRCTKSRVQIGAEEDCSFVPKIIFDSNRYKIKIRADADLSVTLKSI